MNAIMHGLASMIDSTPIFSTHEHHLESDRHAKLTLDDLFKQSYVNWCSSPTGTSRREREQWLATIRMNSYFVWLEKSVCKLYHADGIRGDNWDELSHAIREAHRQPDFHWRILREHARYKGFIEDSYWNPGGHLANDDFVYATYRIDSWLRGFHADAVDHDGMNPSRLTSAEMSDLDQYIAALEGELERKSNRVVALKCASAYERTIRFDRTDKSRASSIFGKHPGNVSEEDAIAFGNFMFHTCVEIARKRNLPIQLHTGLARLSGSNPMLLEPVIASYPDVKFVLFHGGFPWILETAGLAHNYKNVYVDMNWLPLISTHAAEQALHTYLEALPSIRHLMWGGDTWTSEEALGAAMAFKHVLKNVFSEKTGTGFYRADDAEEAIRNILFRNAEELYLG